MGHSKVEKLIEELRFLPFKSITNRLTPLLSISVANPPSTMYSGLSSITTSSPSPFFSAWAKSPHSSFSRVMSIVCLIRRGIRSTSCCRYSQKSVYSLLLRSNTSPSSLQAARLSAMASSNKESLPDHFSRRQSPDTFLFTSESVGEGHPGMQSHVHSIRPL